MFAGRFTTYYILLVTLVNWSASVALHYNQNAVWVVRESCSPHQIRKLSSILNWLESPFVNDIVVSNTVLNNRDEALDDLYLFDSLDYTNEHTRIPNSIWENLAKLRSFIDGRHELSVKFVVNRDTITPLELRWVHFRGNLRIEPLGPDGNPLVVHPGESAGQYTRGGHIFIAMRTEEDSSTLQLDAQEEQHEGFVHLESQIKRIVGVYMMPATHQNCTNILDCSLQIMIGPGQNVFYHTSKLAADTLCDAVTSMDLLFSYSVSPDLTNCFRALLLKYWEQQRLSQVYVNTWAVPTLLPVSQSPVSTYTHDDGLGTVNNGEFIPLAQERERDLFKLFNLTDSLARSLSAYHYTRRRKINSSSPEPPISLVFNQIEVPTRYVPLPQHLLDAVVEEVRSAAAMWLNMRPADLLLTGVYGSREYGHGAVVRWHVDPVHSQPLTAIVHIADECESSLCSDDSWAIQVPRSLSQQHIFSDYSTEAIHSTAWHHIHLRVGQVMLLQSAKLPHARMVPFPGTWYANAFVHFAPVGWADRKIVRILS